MTESRLDRFAQWMGRVVPDAITACVCLMVVLFAVALGLGNTPEKILNAYYQGFWMLLSFTMQMTLIIVLSAALGATPLFRKGIEQLAGLPRTVNHVVLLAVLTVGASSYAYWGLGLALGPVVTVYFAREAERKGLQVDFLFLLALTTAANALWQYGLSSSGPLLVATPGHFLEKTIGVLPLTTTIWSPAALLQTGLFLALLIFAGCVLMPRQARPLSSFPAASKLAELAPPPLLRAGNFSERLEGNRTPALTLCAALAAWLYFHFVQKGASLDINSLNTILLLATLALYGNFKHFTAALQHAVVSAWPVIVMYHMYAGVAGLIQFTTVGEYMANLVAGYATPYTFPFLTALSGSLFSVFIPSSGGQWAIQGYVTAKSAMVVGVSVQRGILSLGVGDHLGNLASPFWYVIAAGIAQVDFRSFYGYGLLFAALWFVLGVVVFTFAPC